MPTTRLLRTVLMTALMLGTGPGIADTMKGMGMDHGSAAATPATRESVKAMETMHRTMMAPYTGDPDADFASHMVPHHAGAIAMAEIELKYGTDPELRALATAVVHRK